MVELKCFSCASGGLLAKLRLPLVVGGLGLEDETVPVQLALLEDVDVVA